MNRIFRKCSNFGLMVRLENLNPDSALLCAKELINGNIPVITLDISKENNLEVLNKVAFSSDLFIAAEGVTSLNAAYQAAGNGAQFFILEKPCKELSNELKNSGFFFLTRVKDKSELEEAITIGVEAVVLEDVSLAQKCTIPYVLDKVVDTKKINQYNPIFSIINLPAETCDYELWINRKVLDYLGHHYTTIEVSKDATEDEKEFANLFAALNKTKIINGKNNIITMETNDLEQSVNYLKWREFYIDPNKSEIKNSKVTRGPLDKELNGFIIDIKER